MSSASCQTPVPDVQWLHVLAQQSAGTAMRWAKRIELSNSCGQFLRPRPKVVTKIVTFSGNRGLNCPTNGLRELPRLRLSSPKPFGQQSNDRMALDLSRLERRATAKT